MKEKDLTKSLLLSLVIPHEYCSVFKKYTEDEVINFITDTVEEKIKWSCINDKGKLIPYIKDCEDHFHNCVEDCHSECSCQNP